MLDADPFDPLFMVRAGLAAEPAVRATSQKAHDVVASEVRQGMPHQSRIDLGQGLSAGEHHVRGVFAFADRPIVAMQIERILLPQPRIEPSAERIEERHPIPLFQVVEHLLGPRHVVDPRKAIVPFFVANSRPIQSAGQVFSAVEADLDRHRQPGLQTDVHQAKFPVHKVEVHKQALANRRDQLQVFRLSVLADGERATRLHGSQHAHQALLDAVLSSDALRDLLLRLRRRRQINERATMMLGKLMGVLLHAIRQALHELGKILVQYTMGCQKGVETVEILQRPQCPAKQHAVEPRQYAADFLRMTLQKRLHGGALPFG